MEEKPPTKHESSAEAEHAPEPRHVEPAPVIAIAGRYLGRFVAKENGSVSWQPFSGYPPLGAELIILTRSAIAQCDTPFEVVQKVINELPEGVLAKCTKNADAERVEKISRKVERHLPDEGLRREMIARRMDCLDRHPDVEHLGEDGWRGRSYADLDRFARDLEAVDRANSDLLYQPEWSKVPEKVVLAILRGLGYPKPENLYRPADREPWTIPKARPK